MTEPQLLKVEAGWLAMMPGDNWAVVGDTPEDALANWRAVVAQHIEIKARRNYYLAVAKHAEIEARAIDLAEIGEPETGPDPDAGLELRPEVVARLKRSQRTSPLKGYHPLQASLGQRLVCWALWSLTWAWRRVRR